MAAVILLAGGLGWFVAGTADDGGPGSSGGSGGGDPTSSTASTTLPPGVTPLDTTDVVWPTAARGVRFTDPVAAVRSFAVDHLGFDRPLIGAFLPDTATTGVVEVRGDSSVPAVTTVQVRRLEPDDDWWVVGATTPNIELEEPTALAAIASPVLLRGVSTAFEATVNVEIRADDQVEPLARTFVMGGANGELGPFAAQVAFSSPGPAANGSIVLMTYSARDGSLVEATVVRVRFGEPRPDGQQTTACTGDPARAPLEPGQTEVRVFFTCGDPTSAPRPVYRVVPATPDVLRAALEQVLVGPTPNERSIGFTSWFSPDTFDMVQGVDLDADGSARVDFDDFRKVIPNASTSAGSAMLLAQLNATVFQFPSVTSVVYRFDGDCEDFTEWLQLGGCEPFRRP